MGDPLDVAVVIVNYETGAWLERCLRSLEGARGDVSVDVVVIDNASGDGSADVSEAFGALRSSGIGRCRRRQPVPGKVCRIIVTAWYSRVISSPCMLHVAFTAFTL